MLWIISILLIFLWAAGLISSYTMGGFIHVLLILAIITALIRLTQSEKIV